MSDTTPVEYIMRGRENSVLLKRYHRTRDTRQRDELVERFMPLARKLARPYSRNAESLDDLTQVAAVGLIKAVERFDPSRGLAFSSFAVPTIVGELKRYFRDHTWAVRPPRALLERALRVERAVDRFSATHGRSPTVSELTQQLDGLNDEDVLEALHARRAGTAASLQAPLNSEDDDEQTLGDRIAAEDDEFRLADQRMLLDTLLQTLSPRERAIVRMRFVDDMTQVEISEVVGVGQMQISRIVRQAIARMNAAAQQQATPPQQP